MNKKMEHDSTQLLKSHELCGQQGTLAEHYQRTLDHLVRMASTNGWKAHAWHRAQEMDADPTGIWKGISQDLTDRMKAINEPISDK
jgi:hypothetical protein